MRLFVSYSSKDDTSVKSRIRSLETARHTVWVDRESPRLGPVAQIQIVDYRNRTAAAGIALVEALRDGAERRGPLPDPLPAAPPIPYEYLTRLATSIDGTVLDATGQLAVIAELRESLQVEEDDRVRADVLALLRRLPVRRSPSRSPRLCWAS